MLISLCSSCCYLDDNGLLTWIPSVCFSRLSLDVFLPCSVPWLATLEELVGCSQWGAWEKMVLKGESKGAVLFPWLPLFGVCDSHQVALPTVSFLSPGSISCSFPSPLQAQGDNISHPLISLGVLHYPCAFLPSYLYFCN